MRPTLEQQAVVEAAMTGDNLKVQAFAGAGKTSTLALVAESLPGRGLCLAFNKSIAVEAAGRFPRSVKCATVHATALRKMGTRRFGHKLVFDGGRLTAHQAAEATTSPETSPRDGTLLPPFGLLDARNILTTDYFD